VNVNHKGSHLKVCFKIEVIQDTNVFIVVELVTLLEIPIRRSLMKVDIEIRSMQGTLLIKIIIKTSHYLYLIFLSPLRTMKQKIGLWT